MHNDLSACCAHEVEPELTSLYKTQVFTQRERERLIDWNLTCDWLGLYTTRCASPPTDIFSQFLFKKDLCFMILDSHEQFPKFHINFGPN